MIRDMLEGSDSILVCRWPRFTQPAARAAESHEVPPGTGRSSVEGAEKRAEIGPSRRTRPAQFLGRPGIGKSTVIREIVRAL